MSTAIEKTQSRVPQTLRQQLSGDYFKQQVALALPKHMTPDRFVRVGLTALMKTPKLMDCTPESVIQCMLNCSALGLEPDGRRAHLIPFNDKKNNRVICTLIIDYKGIVELSKRSGDVSNVFAQVVCDKDAFEWENGVVSHKIDWKNPRGLPYAAYSTVTFKDGGKQTEVLTKDEIYMVREKSSGWRAYKAGYTKDCPWADPQAEPEMWKKTAFKRVSKWITLSPEIADVLEKEDATPFSPTTISTDLQNQSAQIESPAMEAETTIEQDQIPGAEVAAPKPDPDSVRAQTVQEQLEQAVTEKGFTYSDFAQWATASGNMPDADSFTEFAEVNSVIAKRLLRSTASMLKAIEGGKAVTA